MSSLTQEFNRIAANHTEVDRHYFARVVLGSSVIRVFQKGSKPVIMETLLRLDTRGLRSIRSQEAYTLEFESQLEYLAQAIRRSNRQNNRVKPGLKWGHAAKVLCLFHRDMVMHSRYFSRSTTNRLSKYLFTPLDNLVIDRLKSLGYDPKVSKIKEVVSSRRFYRIQDDLKIAARTAGVPRVWFDDNWSDRQ